MSGNGRVAGWRPPATIRAQHHRLRPATQVAAQERQQLRVVLQAVRFGIKAMALGIEIQGLHRDASLP